MNCSAYIDKMSQLAAAMIAHESVDLDRETADYLTKRLIDLATALAAARADWERRIDAWQKAASSIEQMQAAMEVLQSTAKDPSKEDIFFDVAHVGCIRLWRQFSREIGQLSKSKE